MTITRVYSATVSLCLLLFASPYTWSASFSDGDFGDVWSTSYITIDNFNVAGDGPLTSEASIQTEASGGNPGAYHSHAIEIVVGDIVLTVAMNTASVYDPSSQGAIDSIDYSMDLLFDPASAGAASVFLVIAQSGQLFFVEPGEFSDPTWSTLSFTADPDSFSFTEQSVPGLAIPDFSGSEMMFGYALGAQSSGDISLTYGVDNWSLTVNATPIPVPAAFPLLLSALAGVGWFGRGRN